MAKGPKKKGGGCAGVLLILAAAAVVFVLAGFFFLKWAGNGNGAFAFSFGQKDIREYLTEYTDSDTRFIYAHYEGLEEDVENYTDPSVDELPEEERKEAVQSKLMSEYVRAEMQDAVEKREKQVCVIGDLIAAEEGYSNSSADSYYDNGVFRKFPYSTFWLKSYEAVGGNVSVERLGGKVVMGDHWSVYNFEYYPIGDAEILEMKEQIDREAEEILSCIPDGADLWQKARIIHDELIRRISYDNDFEEHCHDLYGALAKHKAVCEGYALAFDHILHLAGGSGEVVVSDWDEDPDTTTHAWNLISERTNEKYIDVTWDDSEYTDPDGDAIILYDYFGLTQEEIAAVDSYHFAGSADVYEEDPVIFNYYRHEGYLRSNFDAWDITELFLRQYESGSNVLTVRFDQEEAYWEALETLTDTDRMNEVLGTLGFYGNYWRMTNDDLHIINIGFGELPETD